MEKVVILGLENIGLLGARQVLKVYLKTSGFDINQKRIAFTLGNGLVALPYVNCSDLFAEMADAKVGIDNANPPKCVDSVEFCQSAVRHRGIIASKLATGQTVESLFRTRINANQTAVRCW